MHFWKMYLSCFCVFRYVLLHHVMGAVEGVQGAWAYPEGGMGAVSDAIARAARSHGAELYTNQVQYL